MNTKEQKYQDKMSPNYYFSKKLKDLGITPCYMGYYYLVDIMDMLINRGKHVHSFSGEIYPYVATRYEKSPCTVERDIRNIINLFWSDKLKAKLDGYWLQERKPKCCEFIYILKSYMIEDLI